jgi:hypothetical protein
MFFDMISMDIKKPLPETFADLKQMGYTWYEIVEFDSNDTRNYLAQLVPEDER